MQLKIKLSFIFSTIVIFILLLNNTFNYFSTREILREDKEQEMVLLANRLAAFLQFSENSFYIDVPDHLLEMNFSNNESVLEIAGFDPHTNKEMPVLAQNSQNNTDQPRSINDFIQVEKHDYHTETDVDFITQVLDTGQYMSYISNYQDQKVMKIFTPIAMDKPYVMSIVFDYSDIQKVLNKQLCFNFIILMSAIGIIIFSSYIFAGFIVEPLQKILLNLHDISNGKFGVQVEVNRKDELGILSERVNLLSLNLKKYQQSEEMLIKSEKLSVVGQLAAGVAHEIRNPLTSLIGFLNLIKHGKEMNKEVLEVMTSELHRIELILSELLVLAKPQEITYKHKNIHNILKDVLTLIEIQATQNNVKIQLDIEEKVPFIDCDENQLKQVFINLLKNAIEAMPSGGNIFIFVKMNEDEKVLISIQDDGCGMNEEEVCKLGEPFFTSKEEGTGLGFMLSEKMIHNHKGSMHIHSIKDVGTSVDIILPLTQDLDT
ncbi:sensor histidine kinase [Chengkuizengella sediminis]|uniref:sensor histidine kinase n=1 Tax=Chengkuizengella sediminis TaxID=1885917 RepID=UPI00138A3EFB|nr:sensor histidine kinase [Chengkuizengella sediminis]NDI34898.1 HAMP domain-containing protein [Chengkuizengella sediminis]